MAMAKRVSLFLITNILVILTLSILWEVVARYFEIPPQSYSYLMGFCVLFGFGGSFISLFMSKWMAKRSMGLEIIDRNVTDPRLRNVVDKVYGYAKASGIKTMPEVAVWNSPDVNAFATGPSRNNSLVAVSTGLLEKMTDDEVDGVIGHEVAHIANGDMVTMTLLQGIINAVAMFLSRVLARIIMNALNRDSFMLYFGLVIGLQLLFSLLGSIVVGWFSRKREFRADLGGAKLAGRGKMIAGLEKLKGSLDLVDRKNPELQTMKISGGRTSWFQVLAATHPPLDERIARLQKANIV